MKNMSIANKTEDDTFEALRRIPQSRVREMLDEHGVWFEDDREQHYADIALDKRMKKWNALRRFFGKATYYTYSGNPTIRKEVEDKLKGTGWTIESYATEVDKPILERRATIHNIKVKRRIYLLCAVLLMLALGVQIAVIVGVVWTQGLLLGLQLSNIITATYHWVVDKYWPYPSYHYRYE
jgi:hypothetical protein